VDAGIKTATTKPSLGQAAAQFVTSWCARLRLIFSVAGPCFAFPLSCLPFPFDGSRAAVPARACSVAAAQRPSRLSPAARRCREPLCAVCVGVALGQDPSSASLARIFIETAESEMTVN